MYEVYTEMNANCLTVRVAKTTFSLSVAGMYDTEFNLSLETIIFSAQPKENELSIFVKHFSNGPILPSK